MSPRPILVDSEPGPVADAVVAGLGDRARMRTARTSGEAVDVVASLDPVVLIVAPSRAHGSSSQPQSGSDAAPGGAHVHDESSNLAMHRAVVERTRWWCEAATVTGAFVVLVSTSSVFGEQVAVAPDEFTVPAPTAMPARAWRAAEAIVTAAGGAVVRSGDADPEDVADLVTWAAAGRRHGIWHIGGPDLDDLHTRVVRGGVVGDAPPPRRS